MKGVVNTSKTSDIEPFVYLMYAVDYIFFYNFYRDAPVLKDIIDIKGTM
jgi:hypothetical protein